MDALWIIYGQSMDMVGGFSRTPLKNMKVNWDDNIPNIWNNKSHVPNHQPEYQSLAI